MKYYFRYLQTHFPSLQDFKFAVQRTYRQRRGRLSEPDLQLIQWLDLPEDLLYLDIGTNRGDTILDAKQIAPEAKVVGFEPNPGICRGARDVTKHLKDVKILNVGLGETPSDLTLYVPVYGNYPFDGLASLHREQAANWLRNRLFHYREEKLSIQEIQCTIQPLDAFLIKPHFIKMDVQGHELAVLRGGEQILRRDHPAILLESATEEIRGFLSSLCYSPYYRVNDRVQQGMGTLNTYFLTEEHSEKLIQEGRLGRQVVTKEAV